MLKELGDGSTISEHEIKAWANATAAAGGGDIRIRSFKVQQRCITLPVV